MKILLFADLHQFNIDNLEKIKDDFDIIVFLGDISASTIKAIINRFPEKKSYGILGNHDSKSIFQSINNQIEIENILMGTQKHKVIDLNLRKEELNEITFTGLEGSVKYKEHMIGYTQEEANNLTIPSADILLSHDSGYKWMDRYDEVHQGYEAISSYIIINKPKIHIFGHYHINKKFQIEQTSIYCIYGCSILDIETNNLEKIF